MILELSLAAGTIVTGFLARRRAAVEPQAVQVIESEVTQAVAPVEVTSSEVKPIETPVVATPIVPAPAPVAVPVVPQKKIDLAPTTSIVPAPKIVSVAVAVTESKTPEQKRVDAGQYEGKLIKGSGDTKTYLVKNGQKLWIILSSSVKGYEAQYGVTLPVSKEVVAAIPSGPSITSAVTSPGTQPKPAVEVKITSQTLSVKEVQNVIPATVANQIKANQAIVSQGGVIPQQTVAVIKAPIVQPNGTVKTVKVAEVTNTGKIFEV